MRALILFVIFTLFCGVLSKTGVKSLTESLGQEVIEIGNPIKELPADLEEEPSIENEEDEHLTTLHAPASPASLAPSAPVATKAATKKETKKPIALTTTRVKKPNAILTSEEEEDRIEKELAEIYKDTVDYRDSAETTSTVLKLSTSEQNVTQGNTTKAALRSNNRDNFKFQPDPFNKAEIERFRTSVDDISCIKKLKASDDKKDSGGNSSCIIILNLLVFNICLFVKVLI